jgi:5-methylcytosine-specific restriction endonuclease McrA
LTVMGGKRTSPKKGLQRKPIRKVSKKQVKRNRELALIPPPIDGKCELCGNAPDWRGLQKHHKIFRSHNGSDDRNNIEFLCGKCHSLRHGINEV